MKDIKADWVCKRCNFWRRSRKDRGVCTLHQAEIFTEEGLRRQIQTFSSDGCERWAAMRRKGVQRVTAEVTVTKV